MVNVLANPEVGQVDTCETSEGTIGGEAWDPLNAEHSSRSKSSHTSHISYITKVAPENVGIMLGIRLAPI